MTTTLRANSSRVGTERVTSTIRDDDHSTQRVWFNYIEFKSWPNGPERTVRTRVADETFSRGLRSVPRGSKERADTIIQVWGGRASIPATKAVVDINLVLTLHFTYYLTSQKSTSTRGVNVLPRVDFGWVRLCVKRRLFFWGRGAGASPFYHMGAIFARFGAASGKARRVLRAEVNEKTFSIFTIKFTYIHERFIDYIRQSRRPLSVRRGNYSG